MEDSSRFNSSLKELLNSDSLFRWELHTLDENRHEDDLDRADGFFHIVSELLKIHHEYHEKDFLAALEIVNGLNKIIETFLKDNTTFVSQRISRAVDHVVQISKATILLHCGQTRECFETLDKMTSHRDLNEIEEAAILAIRSACCALYSYRGIRDAQIFIDRAIRKDPETPFWRFLKAVFLYKTRTALNPVDPPLLEELELLKKLNEQEKNNPLFMIYLADIFRESANANRNKKELDFWFIPQESKNGLKTENENMYKQSKTLYENAYKLRPQCHFIAFRSANGLMKLPPQHQNVKVAKEILETFKDVQNNGFGNTVAAFYYYQFAKKPDQAKNYLGAAMELNAFNAHINCIKLAYKENPEEFDINVLKKMLDTFEEAPKRKIIYAQMVSYYLFVKSNLKLVCQNIMEYLKIGGPRNSLERHVSCFLDFNEPFSLIDVTTDQVKHTLNLPNLQPELRKFYDNFIHFSHFYNLNLDWKSKPQNLRKQILDKKIPETKSKFLREPRSNTNPKYGFNKGQTQTSNTSKPQHRQPGSSNAPPKNLQNPKNAYGQPNSVRPSQPTNQTTASNLGKGPAPKSNALSGKRNFETQVVRDQEDSREHGEQVDRGEKGSREHGEKVDRDKKDSRENGEQVDRDKKGSREHGEQVDRGKKDSYEYEERRNRHSSISSDYHDRHSRHKKHRRRRSSTSTSESVSRGRRRRSPSFSRRHRHKSKDHLKKRHDRKTRRHRYSTSSDSSSSSRDRYEKRGRRNNRRRSYSPSDSSSSDRYEKKKYSRHIRERNPRSEDDERNLHDVRKKMTDMSLDDQSSRGRKK